MVGLRFSQLVSGGRNEKVEKVAEESDMKQLLSAAVGFGRVAAAVAQTRPSFVPVRTGTRDPAENP